MLRRMRTMMNIMLDVKALVLRFHRLVDRQNRITFKKMKFSPNLHVRNKAQWLAEDLATRLTAHSTQF